MNQSQIQIPEFCTVFKEVTENDRYAGSSMAKMGWKMPEEDKRDIL